MAASQHIVNLTQKLHDHAHAALARDCEKLIKRRADPCLADEDGWNAMFWAVGQERGPNGDSKVRCETVKTIAKAMKRNMGTPDGSVLDCKDNPRDSKNTPGRTALHWAACYNLPKVIHTLISCRASIDTPDESGTTPLGLAVEVEDPLGNPVDNGDSIAELLSCRADANLARSCDGLTPLHFAVGRSGYHKVIELIAAHSSRQTLSDVLARRPAAFERRLRTRDATAVAANMSRIDAALQLLRIPAAAAAAAARGLGGAGAKRGSFAPGGGGGGGGRGCKERRVGGCSVVTTAASSPPACEWGYGEEGEGDADTVCGGDAEEEEGDEELSEGECGRELEARRGARPECWPEGVKYLRQQIISNVRLPRLDDAAAGGGGGGGGGGGRGKRGGRKNTGKGAAKGEEDSDGGGGGGDGGGGGGDSAADAAKGGPDGKGGGDVNGGMVWPSAEDIYRRESGAIPGVHFVGKRNSLEKAPEPLARRILRVMERGTDPRVEVRVIEDPDHPVRQQSAMLAQELGKRGGVEKGKVDYGLFVREGMRLPKDSVVCEYLGEVRSNRQTLLSTNFDVAEKKGMPRQIDRGYHFPLEYSRKWAGKGREEDDVLGIDAQHYRNEGGMCNDYRGTSARQVDRQNADFVEYLVGGWSHVMLLTFKDIEGGEEIFVDYGDEYWSRMEGFKKELKQALEVDQRARVDERSKMRALLQASAEPLIRAGRLAPGVVDELVASLEDA